MPALERGGDAPRRPGRAPATVTRVEEARRGRRRRRRREAGGAGPRSGGAPGGRCASRPVGPVVHGVHRGHHGQQHLGGADVATSPSRGGCAARGSAAPGGRPVGRRRRPTRRRGGRAATAARPSRTAMKPACGPPKPSGTPKRWDEPTTTSAPISPGEREQAQGEQVGGDARPARRARGRRRSTARQSRTAPARARVLRAARRTTSRVGQAVGRGRPTTTSMPERLGPGLARRRSSAGGSRRRRRTRRPRPWTSAGGTASWPRPRRWPRRAARRWRCPCRSGRRPSSGS